MTELGTRDTDYGTPKRLTDTERDLIDNTLHVHVYSDSCDCDGRYTAERIAPCPPSAITEEHSLLRGAGDEPGFSASDADYADQLTRTALRHIVAWEIPLYGRQSVTISCHEDDDGGLSVQASHDTEEGYVRRVYEPCLNSGCDQHGGWARDHTAEAAGY